MNNHDVELVRRYVTERSEAAFAELVRRYIDLVYSAALRQVFGDEQQAEDVTQVVFSDLAGKSHRLMRHTSLAGWLYTSTRYAAASMRRAEQRRSLREQEAHIMNQLTQATGTEPNWEQVRPVLDEAMHELREVDREAILLRFFDRLPLAEVGSHLGVTENTARMRVERATEKLRARLALRGICSTAAALGTALAQQAVGTAPSALASRVAARATVAGAGAAAGSLGTLSSWSLAGKGALLAGAVVILAALGLLKLATSSNPRPSMAGEAAATGKAPSVAQTDATVKKIAGMAAPANPSAAAGSGTELLFVDDQTGLPITNRVAWLRGWERGSQLLVEKMVRLEQARVVAPFDPSYGPGYRILTHVEGYADVTLKWEPKRGETVPESYLVRLVRPALIGGRVVDLAGQPVGGAEVVFGSNPIPGGDSKPESHAIEQLIATTDAQGRWQIDRVAPDCVRYLVGSASHPDFSQSEHLDVGSRPEFARQLLEGAFTFRLGPGIIVQGTVVDPSDQPVAGALVHVGGLSETGSRDAHSAADGTFRVAGCRPGTQLVTADAPGFAPAVVSLELEPNLPPVKLALGLGRTLRVRVVDASGQPVSRARLWYDPFGRRLQGPFPQVEFLQDSDAEGRVVWEHAPDQDLEFDCHASGYMRVADLVLHPDEQEHEITLPPSLVISGTVRDVDTGEMVPRFKLGVGWPEEARDGSPGTRWSTIDRFWPNFTGGEFRHSLEEPVIGGTTNRGYVFRFEAAGYAPFITRVYRADEGEVTLDIKLHRADETLVAVYTPAGRPANDAQIALLAPGSQLRLTPGGFSTLGSMGSTWLRKADAQGQFVLPKDDAVQRIAIAHPEGYLECPAHDLRQSRAIRLQPWAHVEGVWLEQGQPVANREISLDFSHKVEHALVLEHSAYRTKTDDHGHFAFPQVPAGLFDVMVWGESIGQHGGRTGWRALSVEARPGETNRVTLVAAGQASAADTNRE
ncbi:MAG TPA: sigma-70 family RNA polymerase sigma factor [Dongiaceae bacterium]|nr:sigma-70 family RNA polymerase sigma factor [Dongiaceae bacterium]